MLIKVPQDASPDVIEFARQVNDVLNTLLGGNNIDLKGRRVIQAGNAVDQQDYVTRADVVNMLRAAGLRVAVDGTFQQFASVATASSVTASSTLAGDLARAGLRP